ncbi:hypothetical protein ACFQ21_20255 [Ohtaekwangia kribbensis]|jgi:hypothetical protein|uniref:PH domain-containing protein n=1 Tax=Ohtaekwangia kribbensis TaxID=688913 RepID=A0ABW3K6K4_9BACT
MNNTNTEEELMGKIPVWVGTVSTWVFIALFSLCIFWFFIYKFNTRQKGIFTRIDSSHVLFECKANGDFTFNKKENIVLTIDRHTFISSIDSMYSRGKMHYIIFQMKQQSYFSGQQYTGTIHQKNATFFEKLTALGDNKH